MTRLILTFLCVLALEIAGSLIAQAPGANAFVAGLACVGTGILVAGTV